MFATLKAFIHIAFLLHNALLQWLNLASLTSRLILLANILSYTLTFLTVINIFFFCSQRLHCYLQKVTLWGT